MWFVSIRFRYCNIALGSNYQPDHMRWIFICNLSKKFSRSNSFKMWRLVVLLEIITSVFNSLFLTILPQKLKLLCAAYFIGDVLGLVILIIAMYFFASNTNQIEQ